MIPVTDSPMTPEIIAELNKLALDTMKGASRKQRRRRTTRRAPRRT